MHTLGEFSLNLSFFLYLLFYFPQLIRNFRQNSFAKLSLSFHALLFVSATADLYYAFGRIDQWQYRLVSVIMFGCLCIQHVQLCRISDQFINGQKYLTSLTILIGILFGLLFVALHAQQPMTFLFLTMGWIERIGYWLYTLPQIIKNKRTNSAKAISPLFLVIGILTAICDGISAWVFDWGAPSLYGAPIAIGLHAFMLYQFFDAKYAHRQILIN